ncbi:MAG: type II toxin-antitoxin system Phd/YefM family antitoxin [Proteobacteria bacterium]|nr:type II toxin-antitoxin system Phd/YefM family antitoxin [Pseudomonadota bacterium]
MPNTRWSLQDAKNKFSAVVDAAHNGEPQLVTKRGKPSVIIIAAEEYQRLRLLEKATAPDFAELLLTMPQDGKNFERPTLRAREVDF